MANIRTCNKHNMIACVEKTEHNTDCHQIVDYLTGCSINYSLLVDPDLIEQTIRADLLFDDADGVDYFPKQVIWDSLGWYNASYADRKKISSIKRADDQDARSWYGS
ncbi:hypothetical protein Tco_0517652 [Tanacetum coccineum]